MIKQIYDRLRSYFAERSQAKWAEWNAVLQQHSEGIPLARVVKVRQQARTGTKTFVLWHGREEMRDAVWVPGETVDKGDYVLGEGSHGHGRHHHEQVYYFEPTVRVVRKSVVKHWRRHEAHLARNRTGS